MKKIFLLAVISLISFSVSFGESTVRGKVTDENGEVIIGATIVLKSNNSIGAATDFDGKYSITVPDSAAQTLIVSYISYQTMEIVVHPVKGEVIIKDVNLISATQTVQEVVVVGKAIRSNEYYIESVKRKSAATLDYVSSETMKKTGDVSVVAAVTRVAGVSTTSTGFITVRGIGDRYVKTAINGSRIPTLDPFTNNIKLDLFPASLVDNVLITKTASPDLPGDWAGAYLSVETKDYPDKLTVNFESSIGYNNQTSFKEVASSRRSSTDWLGYDNGFRDHNHNEFVQTVITPSTYQEFVALGLGDYYQSLGVTANTSWNDTYYKLGLVELGLLGKAQFNDDAAVTEAKDKYDHGSYHATAFDAINSAAVKSSQSFPNNWNTTTRVAPLNFSQNFSIGNQVNVFGKPLGFLAGFRYSSATQYDPNSSVYKGAYIYKVVDGQPVDNDTTIQKISKETNGWSALMNLAYKLNPNNSVSVLFMPNMTGVNNVRDGVRSNVDNPGTYDLIKDQFYESRKQLVYQLKSEHYLPGPKLKAEFNASYTDGTSTAPDFKTTGVAQDVSRRNGQGLSGHRYFRYLSDNVFDSRLSFELPVEKKPDFVRKIKFGGAYQRNDRKSDQYDYYLRDSPQAAQIILGNESADPFGLDRFAIVPVIYNGKNTHSVQKYYFEDGLPAKHSFGYSEIKAGFLMLDYAVNPVLRFSGGLRVEDAYTYTDVFKYDSLGYAPNDPRRKSDQATPLNNPGVLNEVSYLPSANIIYKIKNDELSPVNLRLNYSQTVARPSIRELSDVSIPDYELKNDVTGTPNLKMVHINNYDLRLEDYFKSGDNLSLSLFYKDFNNHIELVDFGGAIGYRWVNNINRSELMGIEVEGKKAIVKHLELRANITIVNSRSTFIKSLTLDDGFSVLGDTVTHTMYGQAPYVINGILTYSSDSSGLVVTMSYNVQGSKLVITGGFGTPDVYERPRHLLDFKVSKTMGKHFGVSMKVQDILNLSIIRSYKFKEGYILDYDRYRYGTNYTLGISYKL